MPQRLFALLLCAALLISAVPPALAEDQPIEAERFVAPTLPPDAIAWDKNHPDILDEDMLYAHSAILIEADTGEVLMLGFTNREAVDRTLRTMTAWFWSRSRQKLWNQGERSGPFVQVIKVVTDCDTDTLLYLCKPDGPTCHTWRRSCFFQPIWEESI